MLNISNVMAIISSKLFIFWISNNMTLQFVKQMKPTQIRKTQQEVFKNMFICGSTFCATKDQSFILLDEKKTMEHFKRVKP